MSKLVRVDINQTASAIYLALKNGTDPNGAAALIKSEMSSLALTLATDPNSAFELTSSTVNGQTFTGRRTMTNAERLQLLRAVDWMFTNNCGAIPSRTRAYF